jgi:hypothetical protein
MSTGYSISSQGIPVAELLGGRLTKYGIGDAQSPKADDHQRCLTDGMENYLWVYGNPVTYFVRYHPNGWPGFILQAIATEFAVEIYCDNDLQDEETRMTPSYAPEATPRDEEIAVMRAEWRHYCDELDEEMANLPAKWEEEADARARAAPETEGALEIQRRIDARSQLNNPDG